MRQCWMYLIAVLLAVATISSAQDKSLRIYFLDAGGGAMTLIVTPLGESVLIDTGSRFADHRDVERILHACEDANVVEIDHLVITHFHGDHDGGIVELVNRLPVRRFYDNGNGADAAYLQATQNKQLRLRAGHNIPLAQDPTLDRIQLHCLASDAEVEGFDGNIDAPVDGFAIRPKDGTENEHSVVLLLTYGSFTFFAGGDATWNIEHHLVHPVNLLGHVDIYMVDHHGLEQSNNPLFMQTIEPTVCVAENGPSKGLLARVFNDLMALPTMAALYQLNYNTVFDDRGNTELDLIANRKGQSGNWVKATVYPDENIFEIELSRPAPIRAYPIKPLFVPGSEPAPGGGRTR